MPFKKHVPTSKGPPRLERSTRYTNWPENAIAEYRYLDAEQAYEEVHAYIERARRGDNTPYYSTGTGYAFDLDAPIPVDAPTGKKGGGKPLALTWEEFQEIVSLEDS